MHQKRRLVAIMFTDIEGYTALMQADEAEAVKIRKEHRRIFNNTTAKYGGEILQYYGDGTLSIFNSVIDAVNCGIEMQLAFQRNAPTVGSGPVVPVRIGIHSGDIIHSKEEIIGNSVNVASRIESLAISGSVLISGRIYEEIKNHKFIGTRSMGWFQLKNVEKPVEVFAISNKGLTIPQKDKMQGKAIHLESRTNNIKYFWNRIQPQLLAGYFVAIWGIIQFADWVLNRYQISTHWIDALLVFFLSLVPSLLLFLWNRERIVRGKISSSEKIIFPGNFIAALFLVVVLFRGTDLGAATETVFYSNENGNTESRVIIKPDFRRKLAVHNFIPEKEDTSYQWMSTGIHAGITEDISQNGYLTLGFWNKTESLQEMINLSKEDFYPFLLTGSYSIVGDKYRITSKLYNTKNGELQNSHTYMSTDLFALIDSISLITKRDIGLNQNQINQFVDLPFDQGFTSNIDAYKYCSLFYSLPDIKYLEKAVSIDSTFAYAHQIIASILYTNSFSTIEAKEAIERGMRFRKRLPENLELNVKLIYFQINNQIDNAIALLKMQVQMNPEDPNIIRSLTNYLYLTERFDELLAWRKTLAANDNNPDVQIQLAEAFLLNGRFEEAGQSIMKIWRQNPNHVDAISGLAWYYGLTGKFIKADSLIQNLVLRNPDFEPIASEYLEAFEYAKDHQPKSDELKKYEGHYRMGERPAEYDIHAIENFLFGKGSLFMGGFFFIPSGPDQFIMGSDDITEIWTFLSDSTGRVYQIRAERNEDQNIFISKLWRQDSLIEKAMTLFAVEKKMEALSAFRIAFERNPRHFYLGEYIKHLEFVLAPENQSAIRNISKYVGRYGPRKIWIENDKFYYSRDGQVRKQRLLPISQDRFYFMGGFNYHMQVVEEKGKVIGSVSWRYDDAIGIFVRDDDDFIAYDQLKD